MRKDAPWFGGVRPERGRRAHHKLGRLYFLPLGSAAAGAAAGASVAHKRGLLTRVKEWHREKKDGSILIKGKDVEVKGSGKISLKAASDLTLKGSKIKEN